MFSRSQGCSERFIAWLAALGGKMLVDVGTWKEFKNGNKGKKEGTVGKYYSAATLLLLYSVLLLLLRGTGGPRWMEGCEIFGATCAGCKPAPQKCGDR